MKVKCNMYFGNQGSIEPINYLIVTETLQCCQDGTDVSEVCIWFGLFNICVALPELALIAF